MSFPFGRSVRYGGAFEHAHLGAPQEEIVELASADRVADDPRVPRLDRDAADSPGAEGGNLLQGESRGQVVFGIELEQSEYPWREPSGADFVAGEPGTVGDNDIPSRVSKLSRTVEPAGPPPTISASQRVTRMLRGRVRVSARVQTRCRRLAGREDHLEQLHPTGGERRL
jgi:hypothetical protein